MIFYGIEIIEPPDGWATLEAMLLSYRPVPRELFTLAAGAVPAQNFSDIPPCVAARAEARVAEQQRPALDEEDAFDLLYNETFRLKAAFMAAACRALGIAITPPPERPVPGYFTEAELNDPQKQRAAEKKWREANSTFAAELRTWMKRVECPLALTVTRGGAHGDVSEGASEFGLFVSVKSSWIHKGTGGCRGIDTGAFGWGKLSSARRALLGVGSHRLLTRFRCEGGAAPPGNFRRGKRRARRRPHEAGRNPNAEAGARGARVAHRDLGRRRLRTLTTWARLRVLALRSINTPSNSPRE